MINIVYNAPNGFAYSSRKAYLRSRKAIHASYNNPRPPKKMKQKRQQKRPKIKLNNSVKSHKAFDNKVKTVSGSKNVKVVHSYDDKENRRKYQNNVIVIEDEDSNIQMTVIDRQNNLKPKKAKYVVTENHHGDNVITEYDEKKRKVAELHIQPSNIRPLDTERSKSELAKIERKFYDDSKRLSNAELKQAYSVGILREIAKSKYPEGLKRPNNLKDERIWLIRKIQKKEVSSN